MRSIRAIENSDVCILMLDATRGIEAQDMNIFQLIQRNNKSLVVVVNKWDLVENKDQAVIKTFENAIRQRMAPFVDFPIIFASALTKQRIFKGVRDTESLARGFHLQAELRIQPANWPKLKTGTRTAQYSEGSTSQCHIPYPPASRPACSAWQQPPRKSPLLSSGKERCGSALRWHEIDKFHDRNR